MQETPLIDCDVHPLIPDAGQSLQPYLSSTMRHKLSNRELALASPLPPGRFSHPSGHVLRADARPPSGGPPGSDPDFVRTDHLDRYDVSACVLLSIQAAGVVGWTSPEEAAALASAFNDFFIEDWVGRDPRFHHAIVVAPQDPELACQEIRRHGETPGVVAVYMPIADRLIGHRHYHPIYAAADELRLPIVLHPSGTEGMFQGTPYYMGGNPSSYTERLAALPQHGQGNLISLIFEGVLEKFPRLRFVFTEFGWTWVPSTMWKMDASWKAGRVELPWVRQPPSDYVRERVRFTTQPVDEPPDQRRAIVQMAEFIAADRTLLFSSDYPHWDNDLFTRIRNVFPADVRERIFSANALETYGARMLAGAAR